jgi:RNA polymerase sigma factor (sigma-70 family)
LQSWPTDGVPANPAAWLTTAAKRRAIDAVRRRSSLRAKLPLLVVPEEDDVEAAEDEPEAEEEAMIADERLRLIFLCCHPALSQEAQIGLTLRLVCGVPTDDIARGLLVTESTMAARITRAKRKIALARIPFRMPRESELPERLRPVLAVIQVLYGFGHTAPSGPELMRTDLADRALGLARMLRELMPDEPEVRGLLALLLVTDARRATRTDSEGRLLRLEDQDRSLWDRQAIAEADQLIMRALPVPGAGRYVLQAAIAALYAQAPTFEQTDWPQIVILYDRLLQLWPSPVVALNRLVAVSMVSGPDVALAEVESLEAGGALDRYHYLPALKADLLHRMGRADQAAIAYQQALELVDNDAERDYLSTRLEAVQR